MICLLSRYVTNCFFQLFGLCFSSLMSSTKVVLLITSRAQTIQTSNQIRFTQKLLKASDTQCCHEIRKFDLRITEINKCVGGPLPHRIVDTRHITIIHNSLLSLYNSPQTTNVITINYIEMSEYLPVCAADGPISNKGSPTLHKQTLNEFWPLINSSHCCNKWISPFSVYSI